MSKARVVARGTVKGREQSARRAKIVVRKSPSTPLGKMRTERTAGRRGARKAASRSRTVSTGRLERKAAGTTPRTAETKRKRRTSKAKPLDRDFLIALGNEIRNSILPYIASGKGREVVGTATSGDATFELDKVAEKALLTFLRNAREPVAYYSEDAGYTTFTSSQPQNLLVVDPVDGTRAAKSGFEGCVVSIVSTRVIERPRVADIDNACIVEILGPRTFYAERGKGARVIVDGQSRKPKLSQNINLELVSWAMTVTARPAELIFPTAAKLIDLTSLKGGFFACNSTAFSLTRLVTNQLDAYVDFANRFLRDIYDTVQDYFINAGRGAIIGIAPYDFAGALLVAQEAGCKVTDAFGRGFDDVLLLDSSVNNQRSIIAAANEELHEKLISFFEMRIRQFEQLLTKRGRISAKEHTSSQ